jgi:uncharacterized membrane protein
LGRRGSSAFFALLAAVAVTGWFGGAIPWWLALFMVLMVGTVRKAERKVRAYDAWLAEWNAMGGYEVTPGRKRKRTRTWQWVVCAMLLALGLPQIHLVRGSGFEAMVNWLWLAACLYLLSMMVWTVLRVRMRRHKVKVEVAKAKAEAEAKDAPVSLLLPPASFSPSRAMAERALPDYCLRLMQPESPSGAMASRAS